MLSRWALGSYSKDYVGTALFLYSKMAELGYEVAQSNAAWILDMYVKQSMCMGKYELCTDAKRHQRAHSLWWPRKHRCNQDCHTRIGHSATHRFALDTPICVLFFFPQFALVLANLCQFKPSRAGLGRFKPSRVSSTSIQTKSR